MWVLVGGVVGSTVAGIAALFYVTVLRIPPDPMVILAAGAVGAVASGWLWRSTSPPEIHGR
ncbi:MAG: hypothetical protein KTR31_11475 [Myxococcales bacterium]|nr:hypothetical protein [Myxococcales bacterium]